MQDIARPRLTLLTAAQRDAVHEASLDDPRPVGPAPGLGARPRRLPARERARVEGDRVYFHRDLVDAAIESAPATIEIFDRRGQPAFRLGDGQTRFGSGVTNLWLQDPVTDELSPFSRADMGRCVRLVPGPAELRRHLDARRDPRPAAGGCRSLRRPRDGRELDQAPGAPDLGREPVSQGARPCSTQCAAISASGRSSSRT